MSSGDKSAQEAQGIYTGSQIRPAYIGISESVKDREYQSLKLGMWWFLTEVSTGTDLLKNKFTVSCG